MTPLNIEFKCHPCESDHPHAIIVDSEWDPKLGFTKYHRYETILEEIKEGDDFIFMDMMDKDNPKALFSVLHNLDSEYIALVSKEFLEDISLYMNKRLPNAILNGKAVEYAELVPLYPLGIGDDNIVIVCEVIVCLPKGS